MGKTRSAKWMLIGWMIATIILLFGVYNIYVLSQVKKDKYRNAENIREDELDSIQETTNLFLSEPISIAQTTIQMPELDELLTTTKQRFYFQQPRSKNKAEVDAAIAALPLELQEFAQNIPIADPEQLPDPIALNKYRGYLLFSEKITLTHPAYVWFYLVNDHTQERYSPGIPPVADFFMFSAPWYREIRNNGDVNIKSPRYDPLSNRWVFSVSANLYAAQGVEQGGFQGAAVIDIDYNYFARELNKIKLLHQTDYFFLVQGNGQLLYHPERELVTSGLNFFVSNQFPRELRDKIQLKILQNSGEDHHLLLNGFNSLGNEGSYFYDSRPLKFDGLWAVLVTDKNGLDVALRELFVFLPILIALYLIITVVVVYLLVCAALNKIEKVALTAQEIARGNLFFVEQEDSQKNDDVGLLVRSIRSIGKMYTHTIAVARVLLRITHRNLKNLMASNNQVRSVASGISIGLGQAHESSQSLANLAGTAHTTADQVLGLMKEQSQQFQQQSQAINQATVSMDEMNAGITALSRIAAHSRQTSDSLTEVARQGNQAMDSLTETIDSISENIVEMQEITSIINEISQQTNLLAMNAAIEAARAGESGKGFTVVADEIRQLAETTAENSDSIHTTLANMVETIEKVRLSGQQNSTILAQIEESVLDFVRTFESIADKSTEISNTSDEINHSMLNINRKSSELMDKTDRAQDSIADITRILQDIANYAHRGLERLAQLSQQSERIELLQREDSLMVQMDYANVKELLRQFAGFRIRETGLAAFLQDCDFSQMFIEVKNRRRKLLELFSGEMTITSLEQELDRGSFFSKWCASKSFDFFKDTAQGEKIRQLDTNFHELFQELLQLFMKNKVQEAKQLLPQFELNLSQLQDSCIALQKYLHDTVMGEWLQEQKRKEDAPDKGSSDGTTGGLKSGVRLAKPLVLPEKNAPKESFPGQDKNSGRVPISNRQPTPKTGEPYSDK